MYASWKGLQPWQELQVRPASPGNNTTHKRPMHGRVCFNRETYQFDPLEEGKTKTHWMEVFPLEYTPTWLVVLNHPPPSFCSTV